MGYIKNEYVVAFIPTYGKGSTEAIEALKRFVEENPNAVGPANQVINHNGLTFMLGPDGSKEGWDESNMGDLVRERFIEAAKQSEFSEVIHFRMGGDDKGFEKITYSEYVEE